MKSVMLSIQPKWVEKIVKGEKTIEVRKTAPKEVPFKAYIYETKGATEMPWVDEDGHFIYKGRGQVISEFVCDKVMFLTPLGLRGFEMREEIIKSICFTNDDLKAYGGLKTLYGWHISKLKIYDKTKELFDFANYMKYQVCKERNCFSDNCWICPNNAIVIRPPQSWCYVEEL